MRDHELYAAGRRRFAPVASPVQFDERAVGLRPAPATGRHTDRCCGSCAQLGGADGAQGGGGIS